MHAYIHTYMHTCIHAYIHTHPESAFINKLHLVSTITTQISMPHLYTCPATFSTTRPSKVVPELYLKDEPGSKARGMAAKVSGEGARMRLAQALSVSSTGSPGTRLLMLGVRGVPGYIYRCRCVNMHAGISFDQWMYMRQYACRHLID